MRGASRSFYFERKNMSAPGEGLDKFLFAVRCSPDPKGQDKRDGDTILPSAAVILAPLSRPMTFPPGPRAAWLPAPASVVGLALACQMIAASFGILWRRVIRGVR
jgi:hypothetical protein